MAFQVSPGVQVKEIDATSVVPAVSTSIGGFAGSFNWGPVEQVVTVHPWAKPFLEPTEWSAPSMSRFLNKEEFKKEDK